MKFHSICPWKILILALWAGIPGSLAQAQTAILEAARPAEPSYCDPARFDETEIDLPGVEIKSDAVKSSLVRAHGFRLGKSTLVGLGVGDSKVQDVIGLSKKFATGGSVPNYCTWYLNHAKSKRDLNKKKAQTTFVHRDIVKNPISLSEAEATAEFMDILTPSFDQGAVNFVSCLAEHHYLALGCNEMMHRGPTVFGMLLALSGCSPQHSLEIVDQTWGLNHVKRKVRLAVIQKAYELGQKRPESRKRLSESLTSAKQ